MFRRLKERLVEEVSHARLPPFAHNLVPQDLLDLSGEPANSSAGDAALPQQQDEQPQHFSLMDEDDSYEQQPKEQVSSFETIDLSDPTSSSTPKKANVVGAAMASNDDSMLLPTYTPPSGMTHSYQSDLESASEVEEPKLTLDKISKEQLYQFLIKTRTRYQKYKSKYGEVVQAYRQQLEEKDKIKSILSESQDRALKRIAELKEESQLATAAKTDMEENFRLMLEENDEQIRVLQTQIRLLKGNSILTDTSKNEEPSLINLNESPDRKPSFQMLPQDEKNEALAAANMQIDNLQAQLKQFQVREEELSLTVAEMKRSMHEQLEAKDQQLRQLSEQVKDIAANKAALEAKVLKKKEIIMKVDEQRQKETAELKEQLIKAEALMEEEKQNLVQELSHAKAASVELLKEQMDNQMMDMKSEHDAELKKLLEMQETRRQEVEQVSERLQKDKEALEHDIAMLQSKLEKEMEHYRQIEEKCQKELETKEKEQSDQQHKMTKMEEEIKTLAASLQKSESSAVNAELLEEENAQLKQTLDRLESEMHELKALKASIQPVLSKLRKQHTNIANLKDINCQNLQEIRSLNVELASCKVKIEETLAQLLTIHNEKRQLMMDFEQRLAASELETERLQNDVQALASEKQQLNVIVEQLKLDKENIQTYLDGCQEFAGRQFEEYKEQVARLEVLASRLENEKQHLVLSLQDKELLLSEMATELQNVQSKFDKQHKELLEAIRQCETSKENLIALQHQLKEKIKTQKSLEESSNNSEKDLRELTQHLDEALDEKQTLSMLMEQMEKDAQDHEAKFQDKCQELEESAAEIASLKDQIATELQFRKQLQAQLHESHNKMAEKDAAMASVKLERDEMASLYNDMQAKLKDMNSSISDHVQMMKTGEIHLRQELDSLRHELDDSREIHKNEVEKLKSDLDDLCCHLQARSEEKASLENQVDDLKAKLKQTEISSKDENDLRELNTELANDVAQHHKQFKLLWECMQGFGSNFQFGLDSATDVEPSDLVLHMNAMNAACLKLFNEMEQKTEEGQEKMKLCGDEIVSLKVGHVKQLKKIKKQVGVSVGTMREKIALLVAEIEANAAEFKQYKTQMETQFGQQLQIITDQWQLKVLSKESALESYANQVSNLEDERQQSGEAVREHVEREKQLSNELETLKLKLDSVKNELDAASENSKKLQANLELVEQQQDVKIRQVQAQLEDAQHELGRLRNCETDCNGLQEQVRNLQSLLGENEQQRLSLLNEKEQHSQHLLDENASLKAKEQQYRNVEKELHERQEVTATLTRQLECCKEENETLNREFNTATKSLLKHQTALKLTAIELAALKCGLSFSRQLLHQHSDSLKLNSEEIWNLVKEKLSVLQLEHASQKQSQMKLETMTSEMVAQQQSTEELHAELTTVKNDLANSQCSNEALQLDHQSVANQLAQLEEKCKRREEQHIRELEDKSKKISDEMQAKLNDLKKKAEAKLGQIKKQLQTLKDDELQQLQQEKTHLQEQLVTLGKELDSRRQNCDDQEVHITELRNQLHSAEQKLQEVEREKSKTVEDLLSKQDAFDIEKHHTDLVARYADMERNYLLLLNRMQKVQQQLSSRNKTESECSDVAITVTREHSADDAGEIKGGATEGIEEMDALEQKIAQVMNDCQQNEARLVKEIETKNTQIDESLCVAEENRREIEKKYESAKQENKKLAAKLLKKEELVTKLKTKLEAASNVDKNETMSSLADVEELKANDKTTMAELLTKVAALESQLQTASSSLDEVNENNNVRQIQHLEEQHLGKIKHLAQEFSARMEIREREFQEELAEAIGKEQQEKEHYIVKYKASISELQKNLQEQEVVAEKASKEEKGKQLELEAKMREMIKEFEDRMNDQERHNASKLGDYEAKWKNVLKQQTEELGQRHEDELSGLTDEWKRQLTSEGNDGMRGSRELEKENRLTLAAMESSHETNELLRKQILALNCEMTSLKAKHQAEVGELRHVLQDSNANQGGTAASNLRMDSNATLGPILGEPTEMEYLRNILYHYMMGRETLTLAKVIAAVVKFNSEQTQQILEKEETRNNTLTSLLKPS